MLRYYWGAGMTVDLSVVGDLVPLEVCTSWPATEADSVTFCRTLVFVVGDLVLMTVGTERVEILVLDAEFLLEGILLELEDVRVERLAQDAIVDAKETHLVVVLWTEQLRIFCRSADGVHLTVVVHLESPPVECLRHEADDGSLDLSVVPMHHPLPWKVS